MATNHNFQALWQDFCMPNTAQFKKYSSIIIIINVKTCTLVILKQF